MSSDGAQQNKAKRWQANRALWAVLIAIVSGAVVAVILSPQLPQPGDSEGPKPRVQLLGQDLPLNDQAQRVALERVRRFVAQEVELVQPNGSVSPIAPGLLGAQIDKAHLSALVRQVRDPTSAMRQAWLSRGGGRPIDLTIPIVFDQELLTNYLLRLKDATDRTASDARMDLEARKVVPEVDGSLLDIDATRLAIEMGMENGHRRINIVALKQNAKRRLADLKDVKLDTVLGEFETHYDRSEKARDRTYNLRLAASKLDGHVLLPGEVFEFNDAVGPRDEANGYKVATVIAEGELVDGIGGGTCQISGTLHGAVFFSGLEIAERTPHTRPSAYIKMGLDATVVYPTIDFKFRNPFDFPIVLHETVKNGIVRAEVLGPAKSRTVTLIRRITGVQPYEELERPDDKLPHGVRALAQRGVPGFTVSRYRIVRLGPHAVREHWVDKYPPTSQIVRVGTGDAKKGDVEVKDDNHPEYTADELLVMTQGEGLGESATRDAASGRELLEWREPGKTGEPGWTKQAKMPQWESTDAERRSTTSESSKGKVRRGNG
jgi:vancomycin resistance protein YoaR